MATIGGRNLGTATGTIKIDTGDVENAGVTVKRVSRDIKKSIDDAGKSGDALGTRIGAGLKTAGASVDQFSKKIGGLRGEIAAVGVAGAALSIIGLKTASNIEEATIQLKGLTGSTEEAAKLMELLRERASKVGVPFADILSASKQLLPTLEGNTAELEKLLPLVQRVAVLNRQEGLAGAAFSINEALSSGGTDLVSLTERFNISRTQLRAALQDTGGDFAAALDIVLNKMGITIDTAEEMGTTFNASLGRAKDAAAQLIGAGFTPLLNAMTPILQKTAEWLNQLRETSPAVATLGAGLAAVAAIGAPTLIFLGQVISSLQKIKALGVGGALAKLGPAAGVGLAAAGGVGAGIGVSRAIGRATGNEELANADIEDLWTQIKQILFVAVYGISGVITSVGTTLSQLRYMFLTAVEGMVNAMSGFIRALADILPDSLGGDQLNSLADGLDSFMEGRKKAELEYMAGLEPGQRAFLEGALKFLGLSSEAETAASSEGSKSPTFGAGGFSDEQAKAITQFYDDMASIEATGNEQRIAQEKQYQEQRTATITEYNRANLREEQDFARSRRRQNEQYSRDVLAITEERVQREADWLNELNESISNITSETNERISEIREEGNARIEEIEADYNQRREQAAREHQDTLLNAASRLDAGAIAAEQRRYATQTAAAETEYQKRIADEREALQVRIVQEQENLAERIAQEQEAHVERIAQAREADATRIAEMREALILQQRIEDEDRAIRLQRTREDHRRQLAEAEAANKLRLAEIVKQNALEKAELTKNFQAQLLELGISNTAYLDAQKEKQEHSLELFEKYWEDWDKMIEDKEPSGGSFASGGVVNYTGAAKVHGSQSRPEYMLNADTTSRLRAMLGNFNQQSILSALSGGGKGGGMNIGGINMPIYAAAGQSPTDIATAVERQLINLFRSLS